MTIRFLYSILLISALAVPGLAAEKQRIAVLELKATGVPAATSQAVSSMLRSQLIDSGLFTVVERTQMDAILKEQGLQQTGCTDAACAVQIGKVLSAKKILIGEISRLGKTHIIACRVVDVEKGVAEFATDAVAENEEKIYSTVKDLVYKLGKRVAGDVKPRSFGKAPEGFYAGYQHMMTYVFTYSLKPFNYLYGDNGFFSGTFGYLKSYSQYLTFSLDGLVAGSHHDFTNSTMIITGIGGGARTGIYLHEKLYFYLGLSLQALFLAEKGIYESSFFGGMAIHPQAGLNIMFTPDIGIYVQAGYNLVVVFDKNYSIEPRSLTVAGGVIYNFFSL